MWRFVRVILLLVFTLSFVAGPSSGTEEPAIDAFAPAGVLVTSRPFVLHAAATIDDDQVLVVGGYDGSILASAQTWDPGTSIFTITAALETPRMQHTATAMADDRVLVVGGLDDWFATDSTEIWEPASGTFVTGGSLTEARAGHTATALPDGRILVVGGYGTSSSGVASTEIWDPSTGVFTITGALGHGRERHTATLLPDGRVLIIGGVDGEERLASAEIWDPSTGSFTSTGSLAEPRSSHSATVLPDRRVLVIGGYSRDTSDGFDVKGILATTEIWDPVTGVFNLAGTLDEARHHHTATALADGRVLVVGGSGPHGRGPRSMGGPLATAEIWDPATGSFHPAGRMATERTDHTATALADGRVLVVGGGAGSKIRKRLLKAEIWSPASE